MASSKRDRYSWYLYMSTKQVKLRPALFRFKNSSKAGANVAPASLVPSSCDKGSWSKGGKLGQLECGNLPATSAVTGNVKAGEIRSEDQKIIRSSDAPRPKMRI